MQIITFPEQPLTPHQHIPPGGIEVVGIPGVGHLLFWATGVFHQEVHLVVEVPAADAGHVAEVGPVHSNELVIPLVVVVAELPGFVSSNIIAQYAFSLPVPFQTVPIRWGRSESRTGGTFRRAERGFGNTPPGDLCAGSSSPAHSTGREPALGAKDCPLNPSTAQYKRGQREYGSCQS